MAASPSPRSPLRLGGIALLGVGVIAAAVGLFTVATGGDGDGTLAQAPTAAQSVLPSPDAAAPAAPSVVVPPTDSGTAAPGVTSPFVPGDGTAVGAEPPVVAAPAPAAPAPAAPAPEPRTGAGQQPEAGAAAGGAALRMPLRVYNNSTVSGLAARAADDLRAAGWTVTEIGGYAEGNIATSTVYFRPGTEEEAAAQAVARDFGMRAEPRFAGIQSATPGLIVIVTREYAGTKS